MISIELDGATYRFDSYDDLEVCKDILEDVLKTPFSSQYTKTLKMVAVMRNVLKTASESRDLKKFQRT